MATEFPVLGFDVDELVDDTLADTCTIFDDNCMSSITQVEFDSHKSPFHESDSGVSDITSVSGASPLRETDIMLDDLLDSKNFRPFGLVDGRVGDDDQDLIAYFNQDGIGSDADIEKLLDGPQCFRENKQELSTADGQRQVHSRSVGASSRPVTRRQKAAAQKCVSQGQSFSGGSGEMDRSKVLYSPSDSEVDIDDDEEVSVKPSRKAKGSVRISKPGTLITKPNVHCVTTDTKSAGTGGTSVKVLQVVHTSSRENAADEVMKALEDRNRRNAEQAKLNRQKKKAYIQSLEQQVQESQEHIDALQKRLEEEKTEKESLKEEVEYLKAVLANQSALAGLLKNIPAAKGVNLSSSFVSRKRSAEMDHSYTPNKKQCTRPLSSAGVCLHVDSDNVSLEFCHHCAQKAQGVHVSGSL